MMEKQAPIITFLEYGCQLGGSPSSIMEERAMAAGVNDSASEQITDNSRADLSC